MSTVAIPVSAIQRQRLERIDAENFAPVMRKAREELAKQSRTLTEDEAEEALLALKQYYAVAVIDPFNRHAVSDAIDPFWHAHILHTRQYEEFGRDVIDGFFHHEPLDHADGTQVRYVSNLYSYTVEVLGQMFNYVNPTFYPKDLPEIRMVCLHMDNASPTLREETTFPLKTIAA